MVAIGDNPIKVERKFLHLTIDQLCRRAHVSKSLVIKSEQGTYPEPSRALVLFFRAEVAGFRERESDFYRRYYDWQVAVRKSNYGLLSESFPLQAYLKRLPVGLESHQGLDQPYMHPFEFWRESSLSKPNLNQISKGFCIHQGLLFKFEQQPFLVNSVPEPVGSALLDAGYKPQVLRELSLAYIEYKQYLRNLSQRIG